MKKLLSVKDLHKIYGNETHALRGVSFDMQEGEFIVIIGMSGSGKSTLMRCINRLIDISKGSIEFKGVRVDTANNRELRKIRRDMGMIFQNYNLIDRLTVIQNVLHGRLGYMNTFMGLLDLYSQEDRQMALDILKRVNLEAEYLKRADQLSGGQKQRVGISRALAQQPTLILADEPIASLDPVSAEIVMDYLYKICQADGISAIVSLHQVDFALRFATRIIGIKDGEIAYDGPPQDLDKAMIDSIYKKDEVDFTAPTQDRKVVTA